MARRPRTRHGGGVDKGRGFFETSSPFETYEPGPVRPKTWSGYSDEYPAESAPQGRSSQRGGAATDLAGNEGSKEILRKMEPEQYDNPRGYPGLSMVSTGDEKSKLPFKTGTTHSILHHMEGSAKLARTGK